MKVLRNPVPYSLRRKSSRDGRSLGRARTYGDDGPELIGASSRWMRAHRNASIEWGRWHPTGKLGDRAIRAARLHVYVAVTFTKTDWPPASSTPGAAAPPKVAMWHAPPYYCARFFHVLRREAAMTAKIGTGTAMSLLVAILMGGLLHPSPAAAQDVQSSQDRYRDASGDITLALVGDAIITRRMSVFEEPDFLSMVDVLRDATVSIANLEMLFHDYGPDIIPASSSGGAYMTADPALADELKWMGFDMVALANNHSFDWGIGGIAATRRAIDAAGIKGAGTGENLARARAPAYLQSKGGRVALISLASSFSDQSRAGPQRKDVRGRPGLNPLRHSTIYEVPSEDFEAIQSVKATLGIGGAAESDAVEFLGSTFRRGERPGVVTHPHEGDLAAIVQEVGNAQRQAELVVVTSHSHEGAENRFVPAQFVVGVRACGGGRRSRRVLCPRAACPAGRRDLPREADSSTA